MNDRIMPKPRTPFTEAHKEEMEENERRVRDGQGETAPRRPEEGRNGEKGR